MKRAWPGPQRRKPSPRRRSNKTLASAVADAPRLMDRKAAQAKRRRMAGGDRRGAPPARRSSGCSRPRRRSRRCWPGLSDGSPYLWDLAAADPERLLSLLNADPDEHFGGTAGEGRKGCRRDQGRSRGDAAAAPHEGGGGAAHRAGRHRRRLAGDAGDACADRARRHRRSRGRALSAARCRGARPAQACRSGEARGWQRPHRAGDGQDGRLRAQLFERHRSDRVLRPAMRRRWRTRTTPPRSTCGSRAAW